MCVPTDRVLVANDPPEPIGPSWFEVHRSAAVRTPSSKSIAVPVNVMGSPSTNLDPSAGVVIVTTGKTLPPRTGRENSYAWPSFSLGSEPLSTRRSTIQRFIWSGVTLPGAYASPAGLRALAAEMSSVRSNIPEVVRWKAVVAGLPTR